MVDSASTFVTATEPTLDKWARTVSKSLTGRSVASLRHRMRDGIVIEPLYMPRPNTPPLPGRSSAPWTIFQLVDDPDPERANQQALLDLAGGANGLRLRFAGSSAAGEAGLPVEADALSLALRGVDLARVALQVEPHPRAADTALWLAELVARRGIAPELPNLSFGLDPVALIISGDPARESGVDGLEARHRELRERGFRGPFAELDGRPYHEAGGSEAQELAAILAAGAWWLRVVEAGGRSAASGRPVFGASLSADCDQLLSIAKPRALRLLWARMQELCGAEPMGLQLHVETSHRMLTSAESETNLVRATIAAFSAAVAGADSICVALFASPRGLADTSARALARNIGLILREEAGLARFNDPAAGSGAMEGLTEALAEKAWSEFQAIEREGGILSALRSGRLPDRISKSRAALAASIADGTTPLVGVTVHRHAESDAGRVGPAKAASPGPLEPVRLEELTRRAA